METEDRNIKKGVKTVSSATTVQKWGNSLAIRIPKDVADRIGLRQGSELELSVEDDQRIILAPKHQPKKYSLDELLSKITNENRHHEIDFGVEGNESI